MVRVHAGQQRIQPAHEMALIERARVVAQPLRVESTFVERGKHGRQSILGLRAEEDPGFILPHRFEGASRSVRDHRPAGGLRFERCQTEILFAGKDERSTARHLPANLIVGHPAEEANGWASQGFQARTIRAVPNHTKIEAEASARLDRQIDPFIGLQPGNNKEIAPNICGRAETARVDGRLQHLAVSPVIFGDSARRRYTTRR